MCSFLFVISRFTHCCFISISNPKTESKITLWGLIRTRGRIDMTPCESSVWPGGGISTGCSPCQKLRNRRLSLQPLEPISSEDSWLQLRDSCRAATLMSTDTTPSNTADMSPSVQRKCAPQLFLIHAFTTDCVSKAPTWIPPKTDIKVLLILFKALTIKKPVCVKPCWT